MSRVGIAAGVVAAAVAGAATAYAVGSALIWDDEPDAKTPLTFDSVTVRGLPSARLGAPRFMAPPPESAVTRGEREPTDSVGSDDGGGGGVYEQPPPTTTTTPPEPPPPLEGTKTNG